MALDTKWPDPLRRRPPCCRVARGAPGAVDALRAEVGEDDVVVSAPGHELIATTLHAIRQRSAIAQHLHTCSSCTHGTTG